MSVCKLSSDVFYIRYFLKGLSWALFLCLTIFQTSAAKELTQQAVASAHPLATQAGITVLEQGGNAFDAAVAISAVLAVVEPYSSGLGGGGLWLLHRAADGTNIMLDGREQAPAAAHAKMYQDENGEVIAALSINGPMSAAIPGEVAALTHLTKNYGKRSLQQNLQAAIRLAQQGFEVDKVYQRLAEFRLPVLRSYKSSAAVFLKDDAVPPLGTKLVQPDLANTLQLIAAKGRDGFYKGVVAKKMVAAVRKAGGIWTLQDLEKYQIKEREPLVFDYLDKTIIAAAPPSSGGVAMAEIFNILNQYPLAKLSKSQQQHLIVEAMRRAYRDRAEYLGDSDFVDVPVHQLMSGAHAKKLAADIAMDKATLSSNLKKVATQEEGDHTSHFSVMDKQGNRVSATLTVNYPFGSGFIAAGTGVVLNDEMDDFSMKPGVPNVYGLVGAQANSIAANKRPLSSMSPTFVESDQGVLVIGTPGGSRIITMVMLGILAHVNGADVEEIVSLPRYHHQYLPDHIQYEPNAFSDEDISLLMAKGHKLKALSNSYGNMHALFWERKTGRLSAASDPRGIGAAIVR